MHIQVQHLFGGLEHFLFSIMYGIIIPTDFHIFQRGGSMNFPMLVPTFQLGHMSNLVYISDAVMVEGPFEPLRG